MAYTKATAVTSKAYLIASQINKSRKDKGLSSSLSAVISEAVVEHFGCAIDKEISAECPAPATPPQDM